MSDKKAAVFGIYPSVNRAEAAVDAFVRSRFSSDDVSVLMSDNIGSRDFAHEKNTKAPEGVAAGGAIGGLVGSLVGMGLPEYEAKQNEGRVKNGGVLLSVHCSTSDEISRAREILNETGADDISSAGEEAVGAGSNRRDRRS
jgi:outer membrane lipoprotein SlyB